MRLIRGVALALSGKSGLAIQDFEWLQNRVRSGSSGAQNQQLRNQVQDWTRKLQGGKNPFGPEVMKQLEAWLNH